MDKDNVCHKERNNAAHCFDINLIVLKSIYCEDSCRQIIQHSNIRRETPCNRSDHSLFPPRRPDDRSINQSDQLPVGPASISISFNVIQTKSDPVKLVLNNFGLSLKPGLIGAENSATDERLRELANSPNLIRDHLIR
jgi:hypothetical protein